MAKALCAINANIKNRRKVFWVYRSKQYAYILKELIKLGVVNYFVSLNVTSNNKKLKIVLSKKSIQTQRLVFVCNKKTLDLKW